MLFQRRKGCSNFGAEMPAAWVCTIRHAVEAQNSRNDLDSRGSGRAQPPPLLWLF
jgi:hypothetical protein